MAEIQVHSLTQSFSGLSRVVYTNATAKNIISNNDSDVLISKAIWDTGATNTCITKAAAIKLNLTPIGKTKVKGVHSEEIVNIYVIGLILNNENIKLSVKVTEVDSLAADSSISFLIGMDVINLGDFAITNFNKKTVMSFRVPSINCIDFVKDKHGQAPYRSPDIPSRNSKCPCGSGKKYKNCCGKIA
jgi:hypothetical protein